jgi:hypothetical protein
MDTLVREIFRQRFLDNVSDTTAAEQDTWKIPNLSSRKTASCAKKAHYSAVDPTLDTASVFGAFRPL